MRPNDRGDRPAFERDIRGGSAKCLFPEQFSSHSRKTEPRPRAGIWGIAPGAWTGKASSKQKPDFNINSLDRRGLRYLS